MNLNVYYCSHRTNLPNDMGRSKIANNVAQPDAEGFGNSQQRVNRDRPFRPFHLTDVNGMEVRFFSQFLLAEFSLLTVQSNILADQTAMFWRTNHSPLPKQQAPGRSHKLPALDCSCVFLESGIQPSRNMKEKRKRPTRFLKELASPQRS